MPTKKKTTKKVAKKATKKTTPKRGPKGPHHAGKPLIDAARVRMPPSPVAGPQWGPKNKKGNTYLMTEENVAAICALMAEGNYHEPACRLIGLIPDTVWHWVHEGDKDREGPYGEFSLRYHQACAQGEVHNLRVVRTGGQGWQSRAWCLERRYPERWGRRDQTRIASADGGKLDLAAVAKAEVMAALGLKEKE